MPQLSLYQRAAWQKSPFCNSESCVEVALVDGAIAIRDTKDPHSPILRFTREEWDAFAAGSKPTPSCSTDDRRSQGGAARRPRLLCARGAQPRHPDGAGERAHHQPYGRKRRRALARRQTRVSVDSRPSATWSSAPSAPSRARRRPGTRRRRRQSAGRRATTRPADRSVHDLVDGPAERRVTDRGHRLQDRPLGGKSAARHAHRHQRPDSGPRPGQPRDGRQRIAGGGDRVPGVVPPRRTSGSMSELTLNIRTQASRSPPPRLEHVGYKVLTSVILVTHFAFLAFGLFGGFLAWRWPRSVLSTLAAGWGLTSSPPSGLPADYAENWSRRQRARPASAPGFIDQYIEGVFYPERYHRPDAGPRGHYGRGELRRPRSHHGRSSTAAASVAPVTSAALSKTANCSGVTPCRSVAASPVSPACRPPLPRRTPSAAACRGSTRCRTRTRRAGGPRRAGAPPPPVPAGSPAVADALDLHVRRAPPARHHPVAADPVVVAAGVERGRDRGQRQRRHAGSPSSASAIWQPATMPQLTHLVELGGGDAVLEVGHHLAAHADAPVVVDVHERLRPQPVAGSSRCRTRRAGGTSSIPKSRLTPSCGPG